MAMMPVEVSRVGLMAGFWVDVLGLRCRRNDVCRFRLERVKKSILYRAMMVLRRCRLVCGWCLESGIDAWDSLRCKL